MRAQSSVSNLVVVVLALMGGCSPDEPNVVVEWPEQPAPEPEQLNNLDELLSAVREVRAKESVEAQCRHLAALEAHLHALLIRYTGAHPEVVTARGEIERLRSELPSEGACLPSNTEQLEQRLRAVEQHRPH